MNKEQSLKTFMDEIYISTMKKLEELEKEYQELKKKYQ